MSYALTYLREVVEIVDSLLPSKIEELVKEIAQCRDRTGTLYIVGLGGSAANATHMAADMRKLCSVDAMSQDNLAEITARANDEGWPTIFDGFLASIHQRDALFVLSVGGGTAKVSLPLCRAVMKAKEVKARILGVVGPHGGVTFEEGDCVIKIPCRVNQTPHTEAFQAVLWHLLVSHPQLQKVSPKWL